MWESVILKDADGLSENRTQMDSRDKVLDQETKRERVVVPISRVYKWVIGDIEQTRSVSGLKPDRCLPHSVKSDGNPMLSSDQSFQLKTSSHVFIY